MPKRFFAAASLVGVLVLTACGNNGPPQPPPEAAPPSLPGLDNAATSGPTVLPDTPTAVDTLSVPPPPGAP